MRGSYRVLFPVLLGASLSACESPLSPSELLALSEAEARWARRSFQDYAFEIRRSCFCEPLVTQWAHVEVRGGVVSHVVLLETGAEVSPQERGRFPTVEGTFASIRAATQDEWLDDIMTSRWSLILCSAIQPVSRLTRSPTFWTGAAQPICGA